MNCFPEYSEHAPAYKNLHFCKSAWTGSYILGVQ